MLEIAGTSARVSKSLPKGLEQQQCPGANGKRCFGQSKRWFWLPQAHCVAKGSPCSTVLLFSISGRGEAMLSHRRAGQLMLRMDHFLVKHLGGGHGSFQQVLNSGLEPESVVSYRHCCET